MYTKKNTRVTFRSNRRPNFKRNNSFSNGKTRNNGNVTQQYNKYLKLAKESSSSGDRIQAEYYYQFTDHYYRLILQLGITLDDSEDQDNKTIEDNDNENQSENNEDLNLKKDDDLNESLETNQKDDIDSIESVPFISEPIKKKTSRVKKITV